MTTIITIHYGSPEADPFKIPRPHHITVDDDGFAQLLNSGEIGPLGGLVGFSKTKRGPRRFDDPKDWRTARALYEGDVTPAELVGWYCNFMDLSSIPFTYIAQIAHIEVEL